MDSINQQQPEDNHKDLYDQEAVQKIQELVKKSDVCFFCTNIQTGSPFSTRPMSIQEVDDQGNLWFLSANDSRKNRELEADPAVQINLQSSSYSGFFTLYGTATISEDKDKIKELWEPIVKTWFTEGIDDPRISVLKVTPAEGYYWDTKHGKVVASLKMIIGALTGQTLDDSIEGELRV